MKSKIFSATFLGIGFLVGATALSALAQWTAAPAGGPPPAVCPTSIPGCNAPINTGNSLQQKLGPLYINTNLVDPIASEGLRVFGTSKFFGNVEVGDATLPASIKIVDGNQGAGKVLTSDANGVGRWATSMAGGASATPVADMKFFRGENEEYTLNLGGATKLEIDAWGPSNHLVVNGEAGDHVKSFETVTSPTCTIFTGNFESPTRYTRVTCGNVVVNALGYGAPGTNQGDVVILKEKCPVNLCYRSGEGAEYFDTGGVLIKYQN